MFLSRKGTSLLFVSNSKSDHIENLKYNEKCAVTIQENNLDWENIKGVQIKGTIELANEKYWDEYLGKFQYISESETLTKAMKKVNLYKLKITWARFIDNSKALEIKRNTITLNLQTKHYYEDTIPDKQTRKLKKAIITKPISFA